MYAARRHYVKWWDFEQPEERYSVTVTKGGKPVPFIAPERISVVEEELMYWRKANHIHAWFVRNAQDGNDDCGRYYVSAEQLRELQAACESVLEASKLVDAAGAATANDNDHPNARACAEAGKVIEDSTVARSLLPTQPGFFFGNEEYDEDYLSDVKDTRDWIVRTLDESERGAPAGIYYHSSW